LGLSFFERGPEFGWTANSREERRKFGIKRGGKRETRKVLKSQTKRQDFDGSSALVTH